MKLKLGAFAALLLLMALVLTACGKPDAGYLKETLAGDAGFYALFDPHVGRDTGKYEITDVEITYEHGENKGSMELSARITCASEEAVFTGSFNFVLNKYDKGWDIDEMALNDYDFDVKDGPAQALVSGCMADVAAQWTDVPATEVSVGEIRHKPGEPLAEADLTVSLGTSLAQMTLPVTLYFTYDGAWIVVTNSVEYASAEDILALAELSLTIPIGAYQYYGMDGTLYSFCIFEEPDDPENPCYYDVICYHETLTDGITDAYYGPEELTDDWAAVICGGICFSFDGTGTPYPVGSYTPSSGPVADTIKRYSGGTGLADGLNALIDLAEVSGRPLSSHAVTVYADEYGIAEGDILRAGTVSDEAMEAYMETALLNPAFDPDDPNCIYDPTEDGDKTDEELTEREFEQKYGYFYGYCDDFGKTHGLSSDQ